MAIQYASNVFATYDATGFARGLVGKPTYDLSADRTSGKFFCYVASKDLKSKDVVKHFSSLVSAAGQGKKASYIGPAKFDDDPDRFIEGKRAVFERDDSELLLELYFFQADQGPVGALTVNIEHSITGS